MDKKYIAGGRTMIAEELKVLFDDLKRDILDLKTDLVIIKYDLEQLDKKVTALSITQQEPHQDPYAGMTIEKF
jgi:hypothetical protein